MTGSFELLNFIIAQIAFVWFNLFLFGLVSLC
jgi:hypothetical protein